MKAGLFGGDWDDISDAIDAYFDQGSAPDFPPSPEAPLISPPSSAPQLLKAASQASGDDGAAQVGDRALGAMASSAGAAVQPVEIPLVDAGTNIGSSNIAVDGAGGTRAAALASADAAKAPAIDQSFLAGREGGQQLQAYRPDLLKQPAPTAGKDPGAGVGITVATGVDLGAHTADDLRRWGVSEDGIAALAPAMGLKGNVARDYAAAGLPSVSAADAQAMDQGALNDITSKVQQAYDATSPATKFADLHPDAQTAIISLAYQYGPNLAARTPSFWNDVTSGDLGAAVGELRNFHDAYPTRRNLEADRMQRGIAAGPGAPSMRVPVQPAPIVP